MSYLCRGGGRERPPLANRSAAPIDGQRPFRPRSSRSAQHGDAHKQVSAMVRRQRGVGCLHRDLAGSGGANRSGPSLARRYREQHGRGMGEARGFLRLRVRGRRGQSVAAITARTAARAASSAKATTEEEGERSTDKAREKVEAAKSEKAKPPEATPPVPKQPTASKSREQEACRQFAVRTYPRGYNSIRTSVIMHAAELDKEFKKTVVPFPKRDVWLRALGRRKG